jgi:hypothetical protein
VYLHLVDLHLVGVGGSTINWRMYTLGGPTLGGSPLGGSPLGVSTLGRSTPSHRPHLLTVPPTTPPHIPSPTDPTNSCT